MSTKGRVVMLAAVAILAPLFGLTVSVFYPELAVTFIAVTLVI